MDFSLSASFKTQLYENKICQVGTQYNMNVLLSVTNEPVYWESLCWESLCWESLYWWHIATKNRSVDAIKIYGVKLQTFYVKLMRFVIENITTRELETV